MNAIATFVKTELECKASCEIRYYDVIGDDDQSDWQVNDITRIEKNIFSARLYLCNVPTHPGAKDDYRSFPNEVSFEASLLLDYAIENSEFEDYFEDDTIDVDFNGIDTYYINREDGKPIAEVIVISYTKE